MKVLFGYLTQSFRGSIKFQLDFASNFKDLEVGFLTSNPHVDYEERVRLLGPIHVVPPTKKFIQRLNAMKDLAKQYDVIYLNKATLNVVENYIVKKAGFKKIVFHSHSTGKDCKNPLVKFLYHAIHVFSRIGISKIYDRMYACSVPAGKWLFGKKNSDKVQVVNNGIDVDFYRFNPTVREKMRDELGLSGYGVLHVGAFSAVKNQGYLVDAFSLLHQEFPNSTLLFVGDGELIDNVKNKVINLGLESAVRFLGYRNDVNKIMQAADLFVLPSTIEGLPFVAIEAQAAGLPCIITSVATPQTKVSGICSFYDVNNPAVDLCVLMKEKLKTTRCDTADEVITAGFDLKSCAYNLELDIKSMFN